MYLRCKVAKREKDREYEKNGRKPRTRKVPSIPERYKKMLFRHYELGFKNVACITLDTYRRILKKPCYYCGDSLSKYGISIDRKDNDKGYAAKNVLPCCGTCNMARGTRFTVKEFMKVGKIVKQIKEERGNYAPPEVDKKKK